MSRDASVGLNRQHDETGAVLILVMIFMIVTSVLIGSLASWAINDLNNVSPFRDVGAQLYAAGGATQVAIRASRYTYPTCLNTFATPCGYVCPPTSTPMIINGNAIQDWCVTTANQGAVSRQEVVSACLMPSSSVVLTGLCQIGGTTQTNGTAVPTLLTATVDFYDKPPNPSPATQYCSSDTNVLTCGLGMTIVSWVSQ